MAGLAALAMQASAKILAEPLGRARAVRDAKGTAAVEFALIGPVLLLILVGLFVFGVALNNFVILTNAAQAGGLQFAKSRGANNPWTDTRQAIFDATPDPVVWQAHLTISFSVNGTACTSDSACKTALSANAGNAASVTASYPCILNNLNLTVMGVNHAPSCTLRVPTTERIQ